MQRKYTGQSLTSKWLVDGHIQLTNLTHSTQKKKLKIEKLKNWRKKNGSKEI